MKHTLDKIEYDERFSALLEVIVYNIALVNVKVHGAPRPRTWRRDVTQRRRREAKKCKENIPL